MNLYPKETEVTREIHRTVANIVAGAVIAFIIGAILYSCAQQAYAEIGSAVTYTPPLSPIVRILDVTGKPHCTGFYVGDGYVVTAGHCFAVAPTAVKLEDGTLRSVKIATYSDPDYSLEDYMILKIATGYEGIYADRLDCSGTSPPVGAHVRTVGFPGLFERLSVWGRIAGKTQPFAFVWTRPVIPVNISIDHGSSGSPLYTEGNNLVIGIMVGSAPDDMTLTLANPILTVCKLLGRA